MASSYSYTNTATGTTTGDATWQVWNDEYSTGTSASTWTSWNDQYLASITAFPLSTTIATWVYWNQSIKPVTYFPPETEQERIARLECQRLAIEQGRLKAEELQREQAKERDRAEALLREHLSEEQRCDLAAKKEFEVVSQLGKRYVIQRGYQGNVFLLDEYRRRVNKYCIHPDNVVEADAMLAQMCWLKWNEEQFLQVANVTKLREAA
jgi:hypothetical protein